MTVNVDTAIDTNIQKLDEMVEKLKALEDKTKLLNFITIREFANIRSCSIKVAQDIFNLPDFPSEDFGKEKVVSVEALQLWYLEKRKKSNYNSLVD